MLNVKLVRKVPTCGTTDVAPKLTYHCPRFYVLILAEVTAILQAGAVVAQVKLVICRGALFHLLEDVAFAYMAAHGTLDARHMVVAARRAQGDFLFFLHHDGTARTRQKNAPSGVSLPCFQVSSVRAAEKGI